METAKQDLMETSSGEAKYEHQHKAIVWRIPRLPKHGQGSYTSHEFQAKLYLSNYDMEKMPDKFEEHFYVEFNQPATCESYTVLRSVSIEQDSYRAMTARVPEVAPQPQEEEMREYEDFPDE